MCIRDSLRRFSLILSWYLLIINLSILGISLFISEHQNKHFSSYYASFENNLLQHPIEDIQISDTNCSSGYTNILLDSQGQFHQSGSFFEKYGPSCVCLSKFKTRKRDNIFQEDNKSDLHKAHVTWENKSILGRIII